MKESARRILANASSSRPVWRSTLDDYIETKKNIDRVESYIETRSKRVDELRSLISGIFEEDVIVSRDELSELSEHQTFLGIVTPLRKAEEQKLADLEEYLIASAADRSALLEAGIEIDPVTNPHRVAVKAAW